MKKARRDGRRTEPGLAGRPYFPAAGMDDYVAKPIDVAQLTRAIDRGGVAGAARTA